MHGPPSLLSLLSVIRQPPLLRRIIDTRGGGAHLSIKMPAPPSMTGVMLSCPHAPAHAQESPLHQHSTARQHGKCALPRQHRTACSGSASSNCITAKWQSAAERRHSTHELALVSSGALHPSFCNGTPAGVGRHWSASAAAAAAGENSISNEDDCFLAASSSFDSFGLDPRVVQALHVAGFTTPSQVRS